MLFGKLLHNNGYAWIGIDNVSLLIM